MSAGGKGTAGRSGRSRRGGGAPVRRYPRAARINEVLRQVLAEEIERLVDTDERLTLVTITAVETDRDLRRATLLFSRLGPDQVEALGEARIRLQATVARQVRLKWTPLLVFEEDPAIVDGQRIEDILRDLRAERPAQPVASDPDTPESTAPESTAPESTAPESTAPESTAPESAVPESAVPESAVPESAVPESAVPESAAPAPTASGGEPLDGSG